MKLNNILCALPQLLVSFPLAIAIPVPNLSKKSNDLVAGGWYAGWHAANGFPLSSVPWDKYTSLVYAFAKTTPDVEQLSLDGSDAALLPQFVSEAHSHNIQAFAAIGGWSGSKYFSTAVATAENRTAFVKTVTVFATKYNLDGLNFDWEYPGFQAIGSNIISSSDTSNFLLFLQALRADPIGSKLVLTAVTRVVPFDGASGTPLTDVSAFASVFDYIQVMNYDLWGSWSAAVGPNAPLDDTCAVAANKMGSAVSAVKAWSDAGMPKNKIVLGIAGYGHPYHVEPQHAFVNGSEAKGLVPYPVFDASRQPLGDKWDNTVSVDSRGVKQRSGGTFTFWGLVAGGFLTTVGKPKEGIHYRYDECSQTPYVYNQTSEVMISFDNARSFAAKGKYIKETGLRGFAMWEAGDDYDDILLRSIHHYVGL